MDERLTDLRAHLARVADLEAAAAVLSWDQETYLPEGAIEARAEHLTTLSRLTHELFTADEIGTLLEDLEPAAADWDPDSDEARLVRVTRREYERATRLPADLVAALARATSLGQRAWQRARAASDFDAFRPHLEEIVRLTVEKAEALGYEERPYDPLLDGYEPEMLTSEVERIFSALRADLVPIVQTLAEAPAPDDSFLRAGYPEDDQWEFGVEMIRAFGFDFERGRQDLSAHPFTTSFSATDVRLTTRIQEGWLPSALFGSLHECGHGLYEQGVARELERTPLAGGASLGVHESQSRLWENLVGRSRAFWDYAYPRLQSAFPRQLGAIDAGTFYRGINRVQPSPIRVEADEVTYNLHIMLRFELENALVEGRVEVGQLPELWNAKMEEYLGLTPTDVAEGVLQDIHWSMGAIGYFPTYSLGNLMSAQLFEQARQELDGLDDRIAGGEFGTLLSWLRHRVHRHGRKFTANELLERVTGSGLSAEPWLRYVRRKFGAIYETEL